MASRNALRRAGVLAVAWLTLGMWSATAAAADTVAFTIKDSRITESSGLARDSAGNRYWTVNDSGDEGMAYGVSAAGKVEGTLEFRVAPTDVEAVAMVGQRLYVADVGDNNRNRYRSEITVYYFDNPEPDNSTVTYKSWDFSYADGRHDAETLLVNSTGRMFVVTKGKSGGVYAAPAEPKTIGMNKLTKVAKAPGMVTDGVFLPGDERIALLTYTAVKVLDAKTYEEVASAKIPAQKQAESLSLSLDGKSLLVGSEGRNSKVYEMAIPGAEAATPTTGTDSDGADADADAEPALTSTQGRRGTFLALGLAAFAALVAGVVVAAARKS